MAYQVRLTERALLDIEDYVHYISDVKQDPGGALKWYDGLEDAIASLEEHPSRCPLVPERIRKELGIRHLIYHSHRIVFRILELDSGVRILRVYHTARKRLTQVNLAE